MKLKDLPRKDLVMLIAARDADLAECHKVIALQQHNIDALEEEHATEASRAYTKELADSLRISDLLRERDQWKREYQDMKARYDGLEAKWTRLNRALDAWEAEWEW